MLYRKLAVEKNGKMRYNIQQFIIISGVAMNKREIGELRRRVTAERSNIEHIYGCYVNTAGEIISHIDESVGMLGNEEKEKYFAILRKVFSGSVGRSLIPIDFATSQVVGSPEHSLLTSVRNCDARDAELRDKLYKAIIPAVETEDNYLILLAADRYDVPHRGKDGSFDDESEETFRYFICCICPVKTGKPELGYDSDEKRFAFKTTGSTLTVPEVGFVFPAFDDRRTNIYSTMLYSKSTKDNHASLIEAVFKTKVPLAPVEQKQKFDDILAGSEDKLSLEQLKAVHGEIATVIEAHKESKSPETLKVSPEQLGTILHNSGFSDDSVKKFEDSCEESFTDAEGIIPSNIIDHKKFEVKTPEVSIKVSPDFTHLISTKIINGRKYVLVSADEGVEVNGISIEIE